MQCTPTKSILWHGLQMDLCKEMCEGAAEQEMELAAACAQDGTATAKKERGEACNGGGKGGSAPATSWRDDSGGGPAATTVWWQL